ncbi:MAG: peptidoglycan DD-metalloendopeptidase family protein [Gammaproteobacteria bacterium]|jgi:septal ring factor EnvC (AmiA/AmiB activator)|nr:peptidoglycan DD-metalloendopeptidase family protein [Gammaproteobacteria bacterium]
MLLQTVAYQARHFAMVWVVCLCLLGLSSIGSSQMCHAATNQEPNKAQLEQRMQTLQKDIKELQNWLQQSQQKASKLSQQLASSERQISTLNKRMRERQNSLTHLRNKIQALQEQASQLQDSLFEQEILLAVHLRQQYQLQQRQASGLLFSLTDAADASRMMAYFRYLHQAQAEQLTAYRHSLDRLNEVQQQQADTELALQQELHQLAQQETKLVTARSQQTVAASQLQQERQSKKTQLADSNAAKRQIKDLLEQLEIALKKAQISSLGQPFAKRQKQLSWPLQGSVLNRFGQQQTQYPLSENGWLIKAKPGSNVQAVHGGQVVFANWLKGYGLLLIIDHGEGYLTLYGQNQSLYKEVGDKVETGELIANSGKTGGQQISALYFSIRKNGQPQDPRHWLIR